MASTTEIKHLHVKKDATIKHNCQIGEDLTVGDTLTVEGNTDLQTTTVNGESKFKGQIYSYNNLSVNGNTYLNSNLIVAGTVAVGGPSAFSGPFSYNVRMTQNVENIGNQVVLLSSESGPDFTLPDPRPSKFGGTDTTARTTFIITDNSDPLTINISGKLIYGYIYDMTTDTAYYVSNKSEIEFDISDLNIGDMLTFEGYGNPTDATPWVETIIYHVSGIVKDTASLTFTP